MGKNRVAVIGSGLAGITAAAFAKQAGKDVIVIGKGNGATAFGSGGLDLAGDPCPPHERLDGVCTDISGNLERLLMLRPSHPYSLIAQGPDQPTNTLLTLLRDATKLLFPKGGSLELEGGLEHNQGCFTTLGTIKFSALFPMNTALVKAPGLERPLVLGLPGLGDFEPLMWAKVAKENAAGPGMKIEATTGHLQLSCDHERPSPTIAAEIKKDPQAFVEAVKVAAKAATGAKSIVLPPVLPLPVRAQIISSIKENLSIPAYELLSLPPSVPGLSLADHLIKRASQLGVEIIGEEVIGYRAEGDQLEAVLIADGSTEKCIEADAFVLAAGKFMGGGLVKERAFRERIFDLPVFAGDTAPEEIFIEKMLGLYVNDTHKLFEVGLKVDSMLRPLKQNGAPGFTNLFAAGAILQGHNYMVDGTGSGVALATGARSGINAAASCSA